MTIKVLRTIALAVCLGAFTVQAAPVLANGSLSGPISNGGLPPGWTPLMGTPDTMDQNNNVGLLGATFVVAPSGASPDGGTWVGMARNDAGGFIEQFGQTLSGFIAGNIYTLSWYAGNFGYAPGNFNSANGIQVLIDGAAAGSGAVLSPSSAWSLQTISFTATSAVHQIAFQLSQGDRAYMSIDGIKLVDASFSSTTPEPATGLLAAGVLLVGVSVVRKRR